MNVEQLAERVRRIFGDSWDYTGGDAAYFDRKRTSVDHMVAGLRDKVAPDCTVVHEPPMNDINHHRIEICLTQGVKCDTRFALTAGDVPGAGPAVVFLEILCSVVAPVAEATWYAYSRDGDGLQVTARPLLDQAWLANDPGHEPLALAVMELGENNDLRLVGPDATSRPADPALPAPMYATPGEVRLRDFLFLGVAD